MLRFIIQTTVLLIIVCLTSLPESIASQKVTKRHIEVNTGKGGTLYFTKSYNKRFEFLKKELKVLDGWKRNEAGWFAEIDLEKETFNEWLLDIKANIDNIKTSKQLAEIEDVALVNLYTRYVSEKFLGELGSVVITSRVAFSIPSLFTIPFNSEFDRVLGFQYQITGSESVGQLKTAFFYQKHGELDWQATESDLDNLFSDEQGNCFFREIVGTAIRLTACATVENSGGN